MSRVTGQEVLSASPRRKNDYGDRVKEASYADIRSIIDAFVSAAVRAKAARFGGIELHAAHGYLLSEFISPRRNRRTDKWGGSTENRMGILIELLAGARNKVGNFPILVKISAQDEHKRGLTGAEAVTISQMLQAASCDAIEVSCGYGDFMYTIRIPKLPSTPSLGSCRSTATCPAFRKGFSGLQPPFWKRSARRSPITT
jgi:2,4-dienoyl-CoA reductase-like NADH-dependent reductase (Old Yellow Enzyme family)